MRISVITATTGAPELRDCLAGMRRQTWSDWQHVVVIDGAARRAAAHAILDEIAGDERCRAVQLPDPTGADGFLGHRIYAAFSHLVSGDMVVFLDEDNWFEPGHLESLADVFAREGAQWAFALRRIVDRSGAFRALDNCESLGPWPTWMGEPDHLVDTSCYFLPRAVAMAVSPRWMARGAGPLAARADRQVCRWLLEHFPKVATNGRHTVNYRVGSRANSVRAEHFARGNDRMTARYGEQLPWLARTGEHRK